MYHTEPPKDKTIREWYMNSSRLAACALRNEQAVRAYGPGRPARFANSKTQNAFLFTVNAIFLHDHPLAVEPGSKPRPLVQKKNLERSSTY